jgi:hypothetical protein
VPRQCVVYAIESFSSNQECIQSELYRFVSMSHVKEGRIGMFQIIKILSLCERRRNKETLTRLIKWNWCSGPCRVEGREIYNPIGFCRGLGPVTPTTKRPPNQYAPPLQPLVFILMHRLCTLQSMGYRWYVRTSLVPGAALAPPTRACSSCSPPSSFTAAILLLWQLKSTPFRSLGMLLLGPWGDGHDPGHGHRGCDGACPVDVSQSDGDKDA